MAVVIAPGLTTVEATERRARVVRTNCPRPGGHQRPDACSAS